MYFLFIPCIPVSNKMKADIFTVPVPGEYAVQRLWVMRRLFRPAPSSLVQRKESILYVWRQPANPRVRGIRMCFVCILSVLYGILRETPSAFWDAVCSC